MKALIRGFGPLAMAVVWLWPGPAASPEGLRSPQSVAVSSQILRDIPQDAAWILPYARRVEKNPQGFWEARLEPGLVLVYIPAGYFFMGSPRSEYGREADGGPVHRVSVQGIWIGKYEVSRETWAAVMGQAGPDPETKSLPRVDVSYFDVQSFLRALGLKTGLAFRLPTEAEWEKGCRGGSPAALYGPLDEIAWHVDNSEGRPHPVGTKRPNGYGLHDMLGNAWEWCSDWYRASYYGESPIFDPRGPVQGKRRVCRGGGFPHGGHYLRSAHRNNNDPASRRPHIGFRLVLESGSSRR
jgi:sulfatase modifying factor 1